MWILNDQVSTIGYEGTGEFVLYAVEAGETLLLNKLGYAVFQWMQLHSSSPVSEKQLLENLMLEQTGGEESLSRQIQELLQELAKRSLIKRVTV